MKTHFGSQLIALALLGASVPAAAAEVETVLNPQKRQEILDQTKNLLAVKAPPAAANDPFHSAAYAETLAGATRGSEGAPISAGPAPSGPRSNQDLLQAIATSPSLKPSGFFVLGGQPTLVFGQKRVKAGSFLTITFEGVEYALEIVSIDRPNFTLRLNREEFTRPIK